MTAVFLYRRGKLIFLLKAKYPELYRKVGSPSPIGASASFIFNLYHLLDEKMSLEDQRYVKRTQALMMFATLVGITMLIVAASY